MQLHTFLIVPLWLMKNAFWDKYISLDLRVLNKHTSWFKKKRETMTKFHTVYTVCLLYTVYSNKHYCLYYNLHITGSLVSVYCTVRNSLEHRLSRQRFRISAVCFNTKKQSLSNLNPGTWQCSNSRLWHVAGYVITSHWGCYDISCYMSPLFFSTAKLQS